MRQAIVTKFFGPTNRRGARVKATADAGSITVPWDHRCNVETNHMRAASALAEKLDWKGHWNGGGLPGSGYVFTVDDGASAFTVARED